MDDYERDAFDGGQGRDAEEVYEAAARIVWWAVGILAVVAVVAVVLLIVALGGAS